MFDPNKWGAIGGDNEPSLIYLALAKFFPQHNFYMIGRSDIKQNRHRIPSNIIDAWEGKTKDHDYTYPLMNTAHITFDGGIFMCGLSTKYNIPTSKHKPLMMFQNATAPIYHFINEHKLDYILLAPDPRYIKNGVDLKVPAKYCFSQYSYTHFHEHLINSKDVISTPFEVQYEGLEKAFLIGNKPHSPKEKTERLNIILNQKGAMDRGPMLLPYIEGENCKIYGKWTTIPDDRFKGPVKFIALRQRLLSTKYTLMIPTDIGWVTSKFWEMVHMGVVPFMHPSYDKQEHLPYSNKLKVNSPEEFKQAMQEFDDNDAKRRILIDELQSFIMPDDYSGEYLSHKIMNAFLTKAKGWA